MDNGQSLVPGDGLEYTLTPPGFRVKHQTEATLLGRIEGEGDGAVSEIVLGTNLTMTGNTLDASGGGGGGLTQAQILARGLGC